MGFISTILFFTAFLTYFSKNKFITLTVIAILSSGYFGLNTSNIQIGPFSLRHGDLSLLLIFMLLPFRNKIYNHGLVRIKKALFYFILFLGISIIYDLWFRETNLMQVFRTTRKTGYLFFFFLISSFSYNDYIKFFKIIISITLIHSLLYLSQYVFGYSLEESGSVVNELGEVRYGLSPSYIIPCISMIFFTYPSNLYKKLLLIIFFITVIFTQSRGAIISAFSIFLFFLFYENRIKLSTVIILPIFALFLYSISFYFFPIIIERFSILSNEIKIINEINFNNLAGFYDEGTLIFRLGLTYERFMYVIQDPIFSFLGVGYFPDMDITQPIFFISSYSPELPLGYETYNSVDIFFPNIITRYGILGSLIFLFLIYQIFKFGIIIKKSRWSKVLNAYLVSMFFISLINESFYNGQYFFIIFVMIGLIINPSFKSTN
jgi:hypothetical protein